MRHKPQLATLALLAALLIGTPQSSAQVAPVLGNSFEVEEHRIAGETSLRSANAPRRHSAVVFVDIVIDEEGRVVAIAPSPDSTRGEIRRWYGPARALVSQWRFRPFLRDGRPVSIRVRAEVEVLRPERVPRGRRPFPDVPLEDYSITLSRGGCLGPCPAYSVTVRGNGHVRFEGISDTAVRGVRETTIPIERVERLIARFRAADFWSLDDRYVSNLTDSPDYLLEVTAGSRRKRVLDYVGYEVGMPDVVRDLQDAVDEAAGTALWVEGAGPGD